MNHTSQLPRCEHVIRSCPSLTHGATWSHLGGFPSPFSSHWGLGAFGPSGAWIIWGEPGTLGGMKRGGIGGVVLVSAAAFALVIPPASADPVCTLATPLPVVGGVLTNGVQTGLLNVAPACASSTPAPQPSAGGGGVTNHSHPSGEGRNAPGAMSTPAANQG